MKRRNPLWVRGFETVEELCGALTAFKRQCNEHRILERLGQRNPAHARQDACQPQGAAA